MESMTRGHGWRFLDMGRKIERALNTIDLLYWTLMTPTPPEASLLEAILEIADSSMTYRRRYLSGVQTAAVLDLLIADETNPRSLVYQLLALREMIEHLPHDANHATRAPEHRLILALVTDVQLADIKELARLNEAGRRPRLEEFLARLHQDVPALADAISHHYLSHLQMSRQLATNR
jgi:uncharacterized alpha-E superfamily protein